MTMLDDKLLRLGSSYRRVLLMALVVVAAMGLYRLILAPFSGQLLAAQRYESTLDSTIRKSKVLGTTLVAKKAKLNKLVATSDRLRNELFTPDEAREFFASLPAAVHMTGCVLQSVNHVPNQQANSQDREPDASGISDRKVVVTFIGGYNNIVRLLKGIQTYKRRVWIDSVNMDTGGVAGKLKCQTALTIYCIDRVETDLYE